jgi:hypothetical protein
MDPGCLEKVKKRDENCEGSHANKTADEEGKVNLAKNTWDYLRKRDFPSLLSRNI